jgi:hypothetical protein
VVEILSMDLRRVSCGIRADEPVTPLLLHSIAYLHSTSGVTLVFDGHSRHDQRLLCSTILAFLHHAVQMLLIARRERIIPVAMRRQPAYQVVYEHTTTRYADSSSAYLQRLVTTAPQPHRLCT